LIVLDTSVVLAFMDRRDSDHERVRAWMEELTDDLATTPLVVAELDHLVARQGGQAAAKALRQDLKAGAYAVEWWPTALRDSIAVAERHASMELGLADASLVALANRLKTLDMATLDERHFRALHPAGDRKASFRLLPYDD
jgi:predicted nucleic acid-binding protein